MAHDDVPDYTEPNVATVATLNIRGGGHDSKAELIAPALDDDGVLVHGDRYRVPEFMCLT